MNDLADVWGNVIIIHVTNTAQTSLGKSLQDNKPDKCKQWASWVAFRLEIGEAFQPLSKMRRQLMCCAPPKRCGTA